MTDILTTGSFDIIHLGHLRLFEFAKTLGQYLVIAIDTDERVRSLKSLIGARRPFNKLEDRIEFLKNIKTVDEIVVFGSDEELESICFQYNPIRVIGGDYRNKIIIGEKFCKKVIYFDRIDGYSTTDILNNKKQSNEKSLENNRADTISNER